VSLRRLAPGIGLALLVGASPARAEWPMFHADSRHTGFADTDVPHDSLLAWSYDTGDSVFVASPVVGSDRKVYLGNLSGRFVCLWPHGEVRWSFQGHGSFRHSTPAIAPDGTIYVGDTSGRLYALHPDGWQKWTFKAGDAIKTSPNVAGDGTIYFGCDDGRLYALDPNGTLKWSYLTGDTIRSSPAIGPDGTVFFGSEDYYLYALRPDGSLRWRVATGDRIKYSSPAVSTDGDVFVGSYDRFLYSFTSAGDFRWAFYTGDQVRSSPALGPDGAVYVGSDRHLYAVNPDGTLRWRYSTNGEIYSAPAYAGDDTVVCVGSDDGRFHVVLADSLMGGKRHWTYTVDSPIRSSPALVSNGNVLVADVGGRIWAFGNPDLVGVPDRPAAPGLTLATHPNPGRPPLHVVAPRATPGRRLWVLDVGGRRVAVLEARAPGRFIWDGLDHSGLPVQAGLYLCRLEGEPGHGRIVLLR
jgi:outer membrane protein assembly factor BamB